MKSGKKSVVKIHFDLRKFQDYHLNEDCSGQFQPALTINGVYDSTALGAIRLPAIPTILCHKCQGVIIAPGFEEWIDEIMAHNLILGKGSLNKRQIRFLRQHLGFSQEALGEKLGIDKHEMSKFESPKFASRVMNPDMQLRMRILFAKLLKIDELEKIYDLAEVSDRDLTIGPDMLPTEDEIKRKFKTG